MFPGNRGPYTQWEGSKKSLTSSEHSEFRHKSEIHQFLELNLNTLECKWLAMQIVFTDDIWLEMNARPED
jgi:hypothetical protein